MDISQLCYGDDFYANISSNVYFFMDKLVTNELFGSNILIRQISTFLKNVKMHKSTKNLQKTVRLKKRVKFFVHIFLPKKAEKMSYAPSYPRYPQKNKKKTNVFQEKHRTGVL